MAQIRIAELDRALKDVAGKRVGVSAEEFKKTEYLLSINPQIVRIVRDYEFAVKSSISLKVTRDRKLMLGKQRL
ncbi:hypothetical protein [Paenibacillus polymyxa]|uniref:hypothetical protein n=1 Tax=Paenibacillus polymyxa TaxID=1406 RepID=UPI0021E3892D|nr:hypothetical protein [Paenibacillus polymyxa]